MTVVGLNFTKISIERKEDAKGGINVKNDVSISDIVEKDFSLGNSSEKGLKFMFNFVSIYEPDLAKIEIAGDVLYLGKAEDSKKILEQWKKDKQVDTDLMIGVLNTALDKCNIKALTLSQDLNLPPPVPLPKVQKQSPEELAKKASSVAPAKAQEPSHRTESGAQETKEVSKRSEPKDSKTAEPVKKADKKETKK